jgi:hypothetical protein
MSDDGAKKLILARRARFVAAAMLGAGAASCSNCAPEPCLSAAPITNPVPTPCLMPQEMPPDAGAGVDGGAPDAAVPDGGAPVPCLSVRPTPSARPPPPRPCLKPPRPKPCLSEL